MRVPTLTLVLAGGLLVLGACAPTTAPVEIALDGSVKCGIGGEPRPTGRNTGDLRRDYECRGVHANPYRDTNASNAGTGRNAAINRALSGRSPR